ncbi:hypothetical protein B1B05_04095 [Domibacillus enclensis]|uniref:Uncharacterized protein n=1 Tax=Domibacillus enclensis TaxID=1017273 RepID=A0ABX4EAQ5_9BACI|nr:hypothetical protein B1B05_04095 [Domibacillus enclensis]
MPGSFFVVLKSKRIKRKQTFFLSKEWVVLLKKNIQGLQAAGSARPTGAGVFSGLPTPLVVLKVQGV